MITLYITKYLLKEYKGGKMSSYLENRGRKLISELIVMLESEYDYCSEVEELKRIKQKLFGGEE